VNSEEAIGIQLISTKDREKQNMNRRGHRDRGERMGSSQDLKEFPGRMTSLGGLSALSGESLICLATEHAEKSMRSL
jgi:hypothetical protein